MQNVDKQTTAIIWTPQGFVPHNVTPEEDRAGFNSIIANLDALASADDPRTLERPLGPLVDRLLLAKGIASVDEATRAILLQAFYLALRDAFVLRERNAGGDYSPDPKATRFPGWKAPETETKLEPVPSKVSLKGLVEDWWREAKAAGRKPSTYESYRNSMARLVAFLKHDDASRVTAEDIICFKDHRLAEINPRTGKHISAKTVNDSDCLV